MPNSQSSLDSVGDHKDLILAYATNSRFEDFYRFTVSARRACPHVDIVVCIDELDDRFSRLAVETKVTLLPVLNVWKLARESKLLNIYLFANLTVTKLLTRFSPDGHGEEFRKLHRQISADWIFPQSARWIIKQDFLKVNSAYKRVFLTDARDVIFQGNPFDGLNADELHVFEQSGIRYGDENLDSEWYRTVYRKPVPPRLAGKAVLCCGTVLGGRSVMMELLNRWVPEIIRFPRRPVEQPMFNEVLSLASDDIHVVRHDLKTGAVLTVCGEHHNVWKIRDGMVDVASRAVPVIHMYDRDDRIKELVNKMYPLPTLN